MAALFQTLTQLEHDGIVSCLNQFSHEKTETILKINQPFVISVWFADMARQYLNSKAEDGSYDVIVKTLANFRNPSIIKFVSTYDRSSTILIEVIKAGSSKFFSVNTYDFAMGVLNDLDYIEENY